MDSHNLTPGAAADNTHNPILLDIALITLGMISLALMDALVKWLVGETYSPVQLLAVRSCFAALSVWQQPDCSFFFSLKALPLTDAVAISFAPTFIMTALSALWLKERVAIHRWSSVVVGFIGVLIITRPGPVRFSSRLYLSCLAAFGYAVFILSGRWLSRTESTASLVSYRNLTILFVCSVPLFWVWQPMPVNIVWAMLAFAGLALLGQHAVTHAFRLAPVGSVAPYEYSAMLWPVIPGLLIWGDAPDLATVAGMLIIVASGLYILHRESREENRTQQIASRKTMRAVYYEQTGAAVDVLKIGEIPLGNPAPGELQIKLMASGVNPSDVKKRAGARGGMSAPYVIPHSDGAGVVEAVGKGVNTDWIDRRVWVCEAQHGRAHGTAAEYVNLPVSMAHPLPENTSFIEGAAIPIPMMTAHRCLTSAGSVDRRTVLVTGAGGRVGYYAVQMAVQMGAKVVATVGCDSEIEGVKSLGAESVVNFRSDDYPAALTEASGGGTIDCVVDVEFGENVSAYLPLLKDNAVIASYSSSRCMNPKIAFYDFMFRNIFIHPVLVYAMPESAKQAAKAEINRALEVGAISHRINHTAPLERIVEAHELIESGCKGSVIAECC